MPSSSNGTRLDSQGRNREQIEDIIANLLIAGSNITLDYDDVLGTLTISSSGGGGGGADEKAKVSSNDTTAGYLNGKLVAGTGITFTENNDGSNETLSIGTSITQYTDEMVQDVVSSLIQSGTGISWSYNDPLGTLIPTVTLSPFSTTNLSEGSNLYYTDERVDDRVSALIQNGTGISWVYSDVGGTLTPTVTLAPFSTSNLSEGSNLYYTSARFDSAFSGKSTSDLTEGSNLYYTASRFNSAFSGKSTSDLAEGSNLYYTQTRFNSAFSAKSTSDLVEGSNLYYTDARVSTKVATLSVDVLNDVDTSGVVKNEVLKWNGSAWVAAGVNESFTFSIASFTSNLASTTVEIGSGTWLAIGAITFTASYLNGPPITAYIACSSWAGNLNLSSPFTSIASAETTAYPVSKDSTIVFTLNAANGESSNSSVTATFRNRIRWGVSTKASGYTSSDVVGLSGSTLSNSQVQSQNINATSGQYLIFAFPSSYTSIHATGFLFNTVTCPFQAFETVSVTNASGFTENYKVYRSTNAALGNSTLTTSTSSNLINPIYYGVSTVSSGFTESNVESLSTSTVSNTKGRTISVTAGASQYIVYALPVRLGTVTFTVGGFAGGFQAPETVSITNVNGYTEDYYVYRSTNSNLGATTVVIT